MLSCEQVSSLVAAILSLGLMASGDYGATPQPPPPPGLDKLAAGDLSVCVSRPQDRPVAASSALRRWARVAVAVLLLFDLGKPDGAGRVGRRRPSMMNHLAGGVICKQTLMALQKKQFWEGLPVRPGQQTYSLTLVVPLGALVLCYRHCCRVQQE